jgi:hypothetical protein
MPTIPQALLKAVRDHKCMLFIGSGLSFQAGYPSWSALIATLVDAAKQVPNARMGGIEQYELKKDFFTLADFARSALGPAQYSALIRDQLGRPVKPTEAHQVIAMTDYRGLITTNYDRLLETTTTQFRQWAPNTFTADSISSLAVALYNPEFFIFKLHGDVTSPESIILTSRDYDRLILRNPHARSFLQAVFLNYTVLFVGYSLGDPDFQLMLSELTLIFQNYIPTHFALLPEPPEFTVEHLLSRMNIQTLPYSTKDEHQEALELLQIFQREAPYVVPAFA